MDLFNSLPKQEQYKLAREILSKLDYNELNNSVPQNNTDIDKLNYLNKELGTNYTSLIGINWSYISKTQKLSENFIREFADKVDWYYISGYQILSESFIREFQDKVDWENISYKQKLSEDFIREFADEVYWWEISFYQDLSESFRKEFADRLY